MTTHECLVAARNRIDRCGWVQHRFGNAERGFCIVGALDTGRADWYRPLAELFGEIDGQAAVKWNDAPGRTKEEVLALFDRVIAATAPQPDVEFLNGNAIVVSTPCLDCGAGSGEACVGTARRNDG